MNFKELPKDGQAFEQLIRELLFSLGLHVEWSGRGPDGGRDLLCRETPASYFAPQTRTWLVQCKHKAHSGDSVGVNDLDDIATSCIQHNATGYLLACSTQPSSGVVNRLEGISNNAVSALTAIYWDAVIIERLLSQPRQWAIAQRFMPVSCGAWQIYATEAPNDFIAHYAGYVFHLTNRIGSRVGHHLASIAARITEIEAVRLPAGHFIRPRAVYYDDKGASYTWYVDYMRPNAEAVAISRAALLRVLNDDEVLEDGQWYHWDVHYVRYFAWSDHYDKDHYDYYTRYVPNFLGGKPRESESDREEYWATQQEMRDFERTRASAVKTSFNAMVEAIKRISYLRVLRAVNCNPEVLSKMERRFVWSDLLEEFDVDTDNILTATLIFEVEDQEKFFDFLRRLPNDVDHHFRASRVYLFWPGRELDTDQDELLFDLKLMVHPVLLTSQRTARAEFNDYFDDIRVAIEQDLGREP